MEIPWSSISSFSAVFSGLLRNWKDIESGFETEKAELKDRSPVKKYLNGLVSLEDRARITVKFKLMLSQ